MSFSVVSAVEMRCLFFVRDDVLFVAVDDDDDDDEEKERTRSDATGKSMLTMPPQHILLLWRKGV